jgi:hypothetical protein
MASDVAKARMNIHLVTGQAEMVLYTPGTEGQAPREIAMILDRGQPESLPHGQSHHIKGTALNDVEAGIPSDPALSDIQSDTLAIADRLGGTPKPRSIGRFLAQDADFVDVEIA